MSRRRHSGSEAARQPHISAGEGARRAAHMWRFEQWKHQGPDHR
jgi:hypothetical protein